MSATRHLYEVAATLWNEYQRCGPGKDQLTPALLEAVEEAWLELRGKRDAFPAAVWEAAERVLELSRRCALRPEGLCFVTGEAGLVPRQDLHRAFEESLQTLAATKDLA